MAMWTFWWAEVVSGKTPLVGVATKNDYVSMKKHQKWSTTKGFGGEASDAGTGSSNTTVSFKHLLF